jgi:gamma-glutamyltranspeptidase/glutathione hydrolase
MWFRLLIASGVAILLTCSATPSAQSIGRNGMVTTSHPLASAAGLRVLADGGNAVDAAIATAAALTVVNPFNAGIGGVGGYALVYDAKSGKTSALDFIGTSPAAASADKFAGDRLWDFSKRATDGYLAPVVPGMVAGWWALHQQHGRLPWKKLFDAAIEYAEKGFPVTPAVIRSMTTGEMSKVRRYTYGRQIFTHNADLGKTLRALAAGGAAEFYTGPTAKKIVAHLQENGGLITLEDLASYRVRWSEPIATTYRGHVVRTHGPGSSGMTILQALNILEGFDLERLGRNSAEYVHLVTEAEKLAFLDDDRHNAGERTGEVPVARLVSKEYAAGQRARIDRAKAQFPAPHRPTSTSSTGMETHHHTVVDRDHNVVTITQTLMYPSGVVVPETGIFLNNGMCYFSSNPADPNYMAGGVRPRFVMSPTIVFRGERPFLAVGAAGGWTIPQTILQTILNVIDFRQEIGRAAGYPRFILRYLENSIPYVPGTDLSLEGTFPNEVKTALDARGHRLIPGRDTDGGNPGNVLNAIVIDIRSGALWGSGSVATW